MLIIKKNNRGFTLTELIIVLVIIGILAAILIPSLLGYVEKAKVSADEQNVAVINNYLKHESTFLEKKQYEVKTLQDLLHGGGYSLATKSKDYYLWYDYSLNKVVLEKICETTGGFTPNKTLNKPNSRLRHLGDNGLLLIDESKKSLSQMVNLLSDFVNIAQIEAGSFEQSTVNYKMAQLYEEIKTWEFADYFYDYHPTNSQYITPEGVYGKRSGDLMNLIFSDYITTLERVYSEVTVQNQIYVHQYFTIESLLNSNLFSVIKAKAPQTKVRVIVATRAQADAILTHGNNDLEIIVEDDSLVVNPGKVEISYNYENNLINDLSLPRGGNFVLNFPSYTFGDTLVVTNYLYDEYRVYSVIVISSSGDYLGYGYRIYTYEDGLI